MKIGPDELEKDGVATVELDKLIVRTLRKMVEKGVMSPLMKLGMAFLWDEEVSPGGPVEDRDWSVHTVGYRVVCSAVLLEKYRHLQRVKKFGDPMEMSKPIEAGSLFDQRSGLVNGKTSLGDKLTHYKKILVARGIIPRGHGESSRPAAAGE